MFRKTVPWAQLAARTAPQRRPPPRRAGHPPPSQCRPARSGAWPATAQDTTRRFDPATGTGRECTWFVLQKTTNHHKPSQFSSKFWEIGNSEISANHEKSRKITENHEPVCWSSEHQPGVFLVGDGLWAARKPAHSLREAPDNLCMTPMQPVTHRVFARSAGQWATRATCGRGPRLYAQS